MSNYLLYFFFVCAMCMIKLKALFMLDKCSTTKPYPMPITSLE